MNVFFGISFFVQPMHARMRAERGLFWYDSLHWYDSPYNTSSTELLGFGATFGVPIRTPLRALSRYSSASGKSTVPEPLFSGLLYLCLFVCLFVCFYCTRGASLPPIYCTSGSGQIYCTKHLWYKGGGSPPLRFGTTGLRAAVPCAYCITTRRLLYRSVACYCIR